MISIGAKLSKAAAKVVPAAFSLYKPNFLSQSSVSSPPIRLFSGNDGFKANPVTVQMINYALSLARSEKSDVTFAQGLLVLEQCQSTQPDDNSKGLVLLAMCTLFYERGNFDEAIEKLHKIKDLKVSSLAVKVAAMEALVGLHLELVQDDASSVHTDICLQLLDTVKLEIGYGTGVLDARAKALKGLVELVHADSFFQVVQEDKGCVGNAALSYGEFLHAMRNFPTAKELYEKVIQGISENKDFSDLYSLSAGNMASEEVLLAATCSLGQLESHLGNFADAEEMLTQALTKTEEHFGSHHPKGLYRRALEVLKAPPLETNGAEGKVHRRDMVALARGGYAELLCVQQNRKAEGERMKKWAETAWGNRRLSLAEALDTYEPSSKVPVVDLRISRVL